MAISFGNITSSSTTIAGAFTSVSDAISSSSISELSTSIKNCPFMPTSTTSSTTSDSTTSTIDTFSSSVSNEIVDIVSCYPWHTNTSTTSTSGTIEGNIPWISLIELEQTVSSQVANLLNILAVSGDTISSLKDTIEALKKNDSLNGSTILAKAKEGLTTIENYVTKANEKAVSFLSGGTTNSNFSGYMSPYNTLYFTQGTGKFFIFPYFTQSPIINITNSYEASGDGVLSSFNELLMNAAKGAGGLSLQLKNMITPIAGIKSRVEGFEIEMSKSYKFNTEGDEITINFPLYNTTTKDAWKLNYRFILLFALRNMPIKKNVSTFVPPVLYNVILPGLKRLSISHVSNITVTPIGMQRSMSLSQSYIPLAKNDIVVTVPEAWQISIKFKSLISNTANSLLSSFLDSPVTTTTS